MHYIYLAPSLWLAYGLFIASKPLWITFFFVFFQLLLTGALIRQLHEITHMAIHKFKPGTIEEKLSDIFYHLPCGIESFSERKKSHCIDHHQHLSDHEIDPSMKRLKDAGLRLGMTTFQFYRLFFYPISLHGICIRLSALISSTNQRKSRRIPRMIFVTAPTVLIYLINASIFDAVTYLVGLILVGPQFHWISLLCEHPWLADSLKKRAYPLHHINFSGVRGKLLRAVIFCHTDSLHALHHIKPELSSSELRTWSRSENGRGFIRKIAQYESILCGSASRKSVIKELHDRLCG